MNEIIKVFEETPRLRTLCGFEEGVQQIDWKDSGKGVADVALLSAELKACRAVAAVESIDLSGCGLAGATKTKWNGQEYVWEKIDSNMDGFIALCTVLGKVRTVRLADCALGARSTAELAKVFRDADAALNSLRCGNNPGMVGELGQYGDVKTPDAHAEVFKELTDSLKTSQVTEADFSSCGIGPVALGHLSDWVREAAAAVTKIDVRGANADSTALEALRSVAPDGCDVVCK